MHQVEGLMRSHLILSALKGGTLEVGVSGFVSPKQEVKFNYRKKLVEPTSL